MAVLFNIAQRKPVWIALSDLYLDTELQEADFRHIAQVLLQSPYTFEEIRTINQQELFPVLQPNLLSPVGAWAGFDERWLVHTIITRVNSRTLQDEVDAEHHFKVYAWMCLDYWKKLEQAYNRLARDANRAQ